MLIVEPTTDESYIKSMLLHPSIYKDMSDDSCPAEPDALASTNIFAIPAIFLRVMLDGVGVGVFWIIWKGEHLAEAHTALLPSIRGRKAIEAAKKAEKWLFENTEITTITSYAWSDAPAVSWFCRAAGLKHTHTEKWPNTRNGKPVDIMYFAITKGSL